jgi:hypothetical protein
MATKDQFLTTREFASQAGLSTSAVTKLIKEGKIKAEKKSGKWMIAPNQLNAKAVAEVRKPGKPAAKKKTAAPAEKKADAKKPSPSKREKPVPEQKSAAKTYSLDEFVAMTYLTEFGVREWLKQGRLTGKRGAGGEWEIDAANLELPDVKRLLRS